MIVTPEYLQVANRAGRAALLARLSADPALIPQFREEAIAEIARRLRTMKVETFVEAVCDILRDSRLEPELVEEVKKHQRDPLARDTAQLNAIRN